MLFIQPHDIRIRKLCPFEKEIYCRKAYQIIHHFFNLAQLRHYLSTQITQLQDKL